MAPLCIAITGGIGTGKSAVSALLASYCLAPLIDVDQCCRSLLDVGEPGWRALQARFGTEFFLPDQRIDREALRVRLFSDTSFRQQLDGLLHPLARTAMRQAVGKIVRPVVFLEIPLLYEAGWQSDMDVVIVVTARPGRQCCRVMLRDHVSRREAAKAIAAQMDLRLKAAQADYCIDNSGAWRQTRQQVVALGNVLCERFSGFF